MQIQHFIHLILFILFSFFGTQKSLGQQAPQLNGKWELQIDKKIDGNISGNNGCTTVILEQKGANLSGKYGNCPGSNTAKSSQLKGQIHRTNRGVLIQWIQQVPSMRYYASWSGYLVEPGLIKGLLVDLEGNQFEFQLSK